MTHQELQQHLKRQITFLRNSAAAYDQGSLEEGIRIAVVLRVLFYDTGSCTSLLKQMGQKDTLQLVTTAGTLPPSVAAQHLEFGELLRGMVVGNTIHYAQVPAGSPSHLGLRLIPHRVNHVIPSFGFLRCSIPSGPATCPSSGTKVRHVGGTNRACRPPLW